MQFIWLIHRFGKMPLAEIPWRLVEKVKKYQDKHSVFENINSSQSFSPKVFLLSHMGDLGDIKFFEDQTAQLCKIANDAMGNVFHVFNLKVGFQESINWHLDPVSRKIWPKIFWGDINYRDKVDGGVKFVWEYNRLYCLFPLAFSFRLTGKTEYAKKIFELIRSWNDANPYPAGINWASGIESGVRFTNLVWALSLLEEYPFSEDDFMAVNQFVYSQAVRMERYPSRYSSANNHLLAEGLGLFLAGLFFPHLKGSDGWYKKGKKIMEEEVVRQILPDGGSFEYSTTYLSFVYDFFLLFKVCCDRFGLTYSPELDKRLHESCTFIQAIMDKNGNVPNIGDQDSAVLVNFGLNNQENFSSILNTGAVLFHEGHFFTGKADLKTFILTGQCVEEPTERKVLHEPVMEYFLHSGLSVIKDDLDGEEVLFCGNATPMGLAPLYAHGHLDALSFTLNLGGYEFFVDSGTYCYQSNEDWRTYFRGTCAHNTIRINGAELSEQTGDFMFGKPYEITSHGLDKKDSTIFWEASHDACKKKFKVDVARKVVWQGKKKSFNVIDTLRCTKPTLVESFFHLHPRCSVTESRGSILISRENLTIGFLKDPKFDMKILSGSRKPMAGWYSKAFHHIEETITICLTAKIDGDSEFCTTLECDRMVSG